MGDNNGEENGTMEVDDEDESEGSGSCATGT